MAWLIKDIDKNGKVTTSKEAENRSVPKFEGNLIKESDNE
jgi:hypothetical protein